MMNITKNRLIKSFFILICAGIPPQVSADNSFENEQIRLRLIPRTPQQMAAFYEARGFPRVMIEKLKQICFIGVVITNKSSDIVWHSLQNWEFSSRGKSVQRFDRNYWNQQWQQMQMPMASRSTFRWTLMPEQLDFRPKEKEGGNITLPREPMVYNIKAIFQTGHNRQGPVIEVELDDVRCAEDRP